MLDGRRAYVIPVLLVLTLLSGSQAVAQTTESAVGAKGVAWEVRTDKGSVFLFGSIHFAKQELYPLAQAVEKAFEAASHLVVEVDIGPEREAEIAPIMIRMASFAEGLTLSQTLSDPVSELLDGYLSENGVPAAAFEQFKPWFVAMAIGVMEVQKLGLAPELGIDRHFLDRAKGSKSILELETIEGQLELFDGLSRELQLQMLEKTLRELAEIEETMNEMVRSWKEGDAEGIEKLVFESLEEAPHLEPFYDKLFTERNHKMAEKIAGYLDEGSSYFVVVGAGHLVGDEGVVALLKKRGFDVERR